jgi:hypothetical protein
MLEGGGFCIARLILIFGISLWIEEFLILILFNDCRKAVGMGKWRNGNSGDEVVASSLAPWSSPGRQSFLDVTSTM